MFEIYKIYFTDHLNGFWTYIYALMLYVLYYQLLFWIAKVFVIYCNPNICHNYAARST